MRKLRFDRRILAVLAVVLLGLTAHAQTPGIDLQPTVILISIDGYRADYLAKYPSPTLQALARRGVRARWMKPAFPSLTFPNHYTIATGLYPDHHGIVGNNIYDPGFNATFSLSKREEVQNGRWWLGEPIWVTAEKQGQRAAAFFFPGTEAEIAGKRPTFWKEFDDKLPNFDRVDTVLGWLDLPRAERPTMITLYFSDVDHAGHDHGPEAEEVRQSIATVDQSLDRLVAGLKARGLFDRVNLIVVSDHGMAPLDPNKVVLLDDYFDFSQAQQIVWSGAIAHVFPKPEMTETIYRTLKAKLPAHARVYRKGALPARLHYGTSHRIGEIIVIAQEGWLLTSRDRFRPVAPGADGRVSYRGMHGFDNQNPNMRAFFLGHGPAFKRGRVVRPFANVDVYHVMTRILGLKPARNDGGWATARLVLR